MEERDSNYNQHNMTKTEELFKSIVADCIGNDIHVCVKNNATTGAIVLTYCAMDAMAFLSMHEGKQNVDKSDFKEWVKKYMKTDPGQPYQYNEEDLYGARCGIVHTYSAGSDLSRKGKCKKIVYKPNSLKHFFLAKNKDVVVLGVNLLIQDFFDAIDKFLIDIEKDEVLKRRVVDRLPYLFHIRKRGL